MLATCWLVLLEGGVGAWLESDDETDGLLVDLQDSGRMDAIPYCFLEIV